MDELNHIDVRLLPPQMRFLVEIIGLPETIVLLKKKGGMLLQIPMGERDIESYDLYEILSAEAIQKLCASRFAGERVTLPKVDKILDQIRNMEIRNSKTSTTRAQLAKKYNLSFRHIQRLWNTDVNNSNLDLFDD